MAKKNSVSKKQQPVAKKDTYVFKDPSESLWGKIVIGLIIFGTIAVILIGAIIAVVNFFS
ncbi:hypothetical protein [Acholeplasma laidlawii]|jgi:hypothetical protein|uniref:DUF4044 domain-containing protein n=1 Tax=Acholeplasma laidlawii TaxID=2148 RepID=A0A553IIP3_ACHLA|nr:hypothetical protein [Acholeplasma laidlawii]MBG0762679.1 hypothetical protein [Acholeplasma laidlawii]NWH10332.1 hypothetical protein [Acholeplasma laidlawii]NWH11721.1 hypothetical protein [Acholeplasma laidlawii]NWH12871.1 hypothetical protein [Acholeplasma laidlawii]NWH15183.1 hypothetical protein [Acholeplasma laidlawii]